MSLCSVCHGSWEAPTLAVCGGTLACVATLGVTSDMDHNATSCTEHAESTQWRSAKPDKDHDVYLFRFYFCTPVFPAKDWRLLEMEIKIMLKGGGEGKRKNLRTRESKKQRRKV